MKKRRIQYNELNEEIYDSIFWTKSKLIIISLFILIFGFLINFSLEERVNKTLQTSLSTNPSCPIIFEKAELEYFLPKIILRKPTILGACFGQFRNRLDFKEMKLSFHSPSFYPIGVRLHLEAQSGKSIINLYPVLSLFSQNLKIEKTILDAQIFSPMTQNNNSPIAGNLSIEGFFEFRSGKVVDGEIDIISKNFTLPSQNIQGFELSRISLQNLKLSARFTDEETVQIEKIDIGNSETPIELRSKGQIKISAQDFMSSKLTIDGSLKLSQTILTNFSFLKLFLPENNTSGNYQLKISGTLRNIGTPQLR
jgi:hypothetical protein